jgi:hypothetical protein
VSRFPSSRKPPRNTSPTRKQENLNAESFKKVSEAIERLFLRFCTKRGLRLLKQLGVDDIREFRTR